MTDLISLDHLHAECKRIAGIIGPEAQVVLGVHSDCDWYVAVYPHGIGASPWRAFDCGPVPEMLRAAEDYARSIAHHRDAGGSEYASWFGDAA